VDLSVYSGGGQSDTRTPERRLGDVDLFISRSAKLAYRIETRQDRLPPDVVVRAAVDVAGLRAGIDREVTKLR
jgi:hypothetical protein